MGQECAGAAAEECSARVLCHRCVNSLHHSLPKTRPVHSMSLNSKQTFCSTLMLLLTLDRPTGQTASREGVVSPRRAQPAVPRDGVVSPRRAQPGVPRNDAVSPRRAAGQVNSRGVISPSRPARALPTPVADVRVSTMRTGLVFFMYLRYQCLTLCRRLPVFVYSTHLSQRVFRGKGNDASY